MKDTEHGHGIEVSHAREQGKMAAEINDDDTNNSVLPHDCPYGPGELRDAWMAGAGFPQEEVRQVDTSTANTDDVRREPAETVRKAPASRSRGGKGRGGKGRGKSAGDKTAGDKTAVTTDTTGNAETSLVTKTASAKPEEASTTNVETKLGDPRGTEGDRTTVDAEKLM